MPAELLDEFEEEDLDELVEDDDVNTEEVADDLEKLDPAEDADIDEVDDALDELDETAATAELTEEEWTDELEDDICVGFVIVQVKLCWADPPV